MCLVLFTRDQSAQVWRVEVRRIGLIQFIIQPFIFTPGALICCGDTLNPSFYLTLLCTRKPEEPLNVEDLVQRNGIAA